MRQGPALFCLLAAVLAACGRPAPSGDAAAAGGADPLVVYSGRSESLIGPLLERFTESTGIPVEVRYASTAELAATLLEEGARSPAHLFISQDAAALGALEAAGRLHALPAELLAGVDPRFTAGESRAWVGLSGRARCLVHHTGLTAAELPRSLEDLTDPRHRGRFGIAPSNASLQAQLALYRALHGPEALEGLLTGLAANEPQSYPNNGAIVDAVVAGEIDYGLVNHYYLWRVLAETPAAPAANYFLPEGEGSAWVNVAGVGLLDERREGLELVRFLLAPEAQSYFASETFEYPVVTGIDPAPGLPPLSDLRTPDIDPSAVAAVLDETLMAIRDSGLLR